MPKKPRKTVPAVGATESVALRLTRIEDLLIEMRGVLDVHLKRIGALQVQVDLLIDKDRVE